MISQKTSQKAKKVLTSLLLLSIISPPPSYAVKGQPNLMSEFEEMERPRREGIKCSKKQKVVAVTLGGLTVAALCAAGGAFAATRRAVSSSLSDSRDGSNLTVTPAFHNGMFFSESSDSTPDHVAFFDQNGVLKPEQQEAMLKDFFSTSHRLCFSASPSSIIGAAETIFEEDPYSCRHLDLSSTAEPDFFPFTLVESANEKDWKRSVYIYLAMPSTRSLQDRFLDLKGVALKCRKGGGDYSKYCRWSIGSSILKYWDKNVPGDEDCLFISRVGGKKLKGLFFSNQAVNEWGFKEGCRIASLEKVSEGVVLDLLEKIVFSERAPFVAAFVKRKGLGLSGSKGAAEDSAPGQLAFDEPSAQDPGSPAFIGKKGREKRALAHSRGTSLLGFVSLLSNVRSTGSIDLKYSAKPKSSLRDRQVENRSGRHVTLPKYPKNVRGKR